MIRLKSKCKECVDCIPKVIATFTTNRSNPIWDLTPYQGIGIGLPNTKWRIWERGYDREYESGNIDTNGILVGLPAQFESTYYYDGYMELQQGCPNWCCDDDWCDDVEWPS